MVKQIERTNTSSSDRIISYVPPKNVHIIWGQVEPLLLKAVMYDDFSYNGQNLLDGILQKDMQLWISWTHKV